MILSFSGFYVPKSSPISQSRTTSVCSNPPQTEQTEIATETELAESLDQCEQDEGWTTVPKSKHRTKSADYIDEFPDDVLISQIGAFL